MSSFRSCWRTHFTSRSEDVLDFNNFQGQELVLKWHTDVACTKASQHPNTSIASSKTASKDIVLLNVCTVEAKKNNGIPLDPFLLSIHQSPKFMNRWHFFIAQRPLWKPVPQHWLISTSTGTLGDLPLCYSVWLLTEFAWSSGWDWCKTWCIPCADINDFCGGSARSSENAFFSNTAEWRCANSFIERNESFGINLCHTNKVKPKVAFSNTRWKKNSLYPPPPLNSDTPKTYSLSPRILLGSCVHSSA